MTYIKVVGQVKTFSHNENIQQVFAVFRDLLRLKKRLLIKNLLKDLCWVLYQELFVLCFDRLIFVRRLTSNDHNGSIIDLNEICLFFFFQIL